MHKNEDPPKWGHNLVCFAFFLFSLTRAPKIWDLYPCISFSLCSFLHFKRTKDYHVLSFFGVCSFP